MPKYTVIIGGKERTIDKDKFDGNVEAISAKYPDARIKAKNGDVEGMLPVSNYSKAIKQGYRMVEMEDMEPMVAPKTSESVSPVVDSSGVQQMDSVRDYRPEIAGDVNNRFNLVKEMNEPTDAQKREEERKQIEAQATQAKRAADERSLNSKNEVIHEDAQAIRDNPFSMVTELLTGMTSMTPKQAEARKSAELNRATAEKAEDTYNMIEEAKKKGNTNFVEGFGRGFWEKASKASTWDFGARDLQSNLAVSAAAKKYSEGVPLSAEEETLLDAVALEAAAQGEFSGDLGRGYKAGGTTAESIPFMAEFMINPATGTGKVVGKAAAKKIITNFGKEAAKSTIGKIARSSARVAGDVAGAGIMAGTTGVMRTSADAVDRITGEVKPVVDADGYYRFGGTEEGDSGMKAFAKAYGASTIENFSEMFGNYLVPMGAAVGELAGRSMKGIGLGKVNDIIGRVRSSDIAKIVDDFQGRTQWNGTIGEYLEEQAGMAMNALTVGDNQLSDLVDVDTQIDTFLGVSAFGGLFSGVKTAGYAREKYVQRKRMNEAGREASVSIGEGWEVIKGQIDAADDAELVSILGSSLTDEGMSEKQKQDVLLYAGRLKAYHGANLADLKRKTEGDTPEGMVHAQINFDAGYKLAEADRREKRKAAKELESVERKLDDDFLSSDESVQYDLMRQRAESGEDVSKELAYINALSRFEGMIHGIRDVIDEKVAISNQYISRVSHQDGNVYDVTLSGDANKHVFPVSGAIVVDENGIVDRKHSDSRFIVRDENGKVEMRSVDDLYKVESMDNAEVLKEVSAQSIREQESARYAEEIETPGEEEKAEKIAALQPGSEVTLNVGGVAREAVVQNVYSDGGIELRFEDKITGHDGKEKNVDVFSSDEVKTLLIPKEDASLGEGDVKNGAENEAEVGENTGLIQMNDEKSDIMPTTGVEAEALPGEELLPDALTESEDTGNSVPVDEKGNLLYHRAPVEVTLESVGSYGLDEAETDGFVSAQKSDASNRLKKLQKGKPKVGTNLAKYQSEKRAWEDSLADAQAQADYWDEVDEQIQATRIQPGDMTAEAINSMGDAMNGEEFAAMMLGTRKLPLLFDDYKRETGFSSKDAMRMLGLFAEKANGGMSIEQAGEKLMEMDAANGTMFFDQADANAGRNAVLEVLSSSRTRGGLFGYIKGNRERMAEQEREAEYSAYEQWVKDAKHMSVAEHEADEETIESRMKEISESFNFDEINGDIADDLIIEENDRRTKESGVEPITGGGAENIQGEFDGSAESGGVGRPEISGVIGESQEWREGSADENGISGADVVGTQQSGERIEGDLFGYARRGDSAQKTAEEKADNDLLSTEDSVSLQEGNKKESSNEILESVSQGEHRSLLEGDGGAEEPLHRLRRRIEEASGDAQKGEGGRGGHREGSGGDQQEVNRIIETQAKEDGLWTSIQNTANLGAPFLSGNENDTYLDRENGVVYKVNNLMNSKDLPSLFRRIDLHNEYFPHTKYEFVGVTGFGNGSAVYPIYKQEFVQNAEFATTAEIDAYMESLGFNRVSEAAYSNGDVVISDLRPRNVLKSSAGNIYVIDADLKKENKGSSVGYKEGESLFDYARRIDDSQRVIREEGMVDTNPTEAQKEAGNYQMGHVKIGRHDVTIENPKGSVRRGVDKDGKEWEISMNNTYGYFRGTKGKDGDHIDAFLGDNLEPKSVYVVDQVNEDGTFDEHKVMYGFDTEEDAKAAYMSNYEEGWKGFGNITGVPREVFDEWLKTGTKKQKPFAEYKAARGDATTDDNIRFRVVDENDVEFMPSAEEQGIIERAKAEGSYLKAPNGVDTNLSPTQWVQVRTKLFQDWFGDWQNNPEGASRVVDENGEPMVVYHGTDSEFFSFNHDKVQRNGFYFAKDKDAVKRFNGGTYVVDAFLNIKKPLHRNYTPVISKKMMDIGDGVIADKISLNEEIPTYVAFYPNQIKSATENNGEYSKENDDIRFRSKEIDNLQTSANEFASQFMVDDIISVLDHDAFVDKLKENGIEEVEGPAINMSNGTILIDSSVVNDENVMKKYVAHEVFHTFVRTELSVDEVEEVGNEIGEEQLNEFLPGYESGDVYQKVNELIAYIGSELQKKDLLARLFTGEISSNYVSEWMIKNLKDDSISKILPLINKILSNYERRRNESKTSVDPYKRGDIEQTVLERRGNGGYADSEREARTGNTKTSHSKKGVLGLLGEEFDISRGTDRESIGANGGVESETSRKERVVSVGRIRNEIQSLTDKLKTPIRVVGNVWEIVDDNPKLQQRKRDSKGWFDSSTGEIAIVLPNASSVEDVQSTILHEVVAHKGLRDMFGDEFDSFLDKVYRDVDGVIREKITALSRKHGFDTRVATEEYLAGLAERGFEDVTEKSVWNKVKDFFMEMLSKAGIRMSAPLGDADLRYILWRSHENQVRGGDIVVKAKDATMRGISKADVRFREEAEQENEGIAKREYEDSLDKAKNKMYRWQEAYQDSMLGLKKMQEAIEKESGEKLKYFEDAYMAENQMSSRSGYETDVYKDKFFVPMMDAVRALVKNGAKQKNVSRYVMAKHGLERNVVFAKRDAERDANDEFEQEYLDAKSSIDKGDIGHDEWEEMVNDIDARKKDFYEEMYAKNRMRDYSGLKQLTDEEENFEEAAMDLVDTFEDAHSSLCDVLWERVNAATKQTLKKSYESGLMTKSTYDKVRGMFEYYVPLRGWDDKVASDVYEYVLSERSVFQAPVKTAFGRESLADDPFANIGNMAESGILQGNRNLMKQKFLNMVLNHPTSLATVKTMWYENVGSSESPVWEQSLPYIKPDATAEEISQAIDDHEVRMAELRKGGMTKKSTKGVSLDYRASTREINEHVVVVKSGGREHVIFVNGNPRAAQAINGLTNPDTTDHKFMQTIGKTNRQLAANFTTRNPAFVLSNMSRDVIFSTSAIWVKEDWKYAKRFDKNIVKNIGGIVGLMARYKSGRLDMRNQRDRYFLEFLENGGETGYTALHNVDEYKKMMNRYVRKSDGSWGSVSYGLHAIVDSVSFMNRCAENVSRFTTYQTSREMGRGIAESVRDAKEVTVNFNKKGAGGLGAGTIKSLFLFFNAAVQSLSNFKGLHDKSKPKFYATLGGFAAAGILLPMINNAIIEMLVGDDDDEMSDEERAAWKRKRDSYDNLPEWVRKNNFCIWTGGESFITTPLPIELRAFYGLGEMWYQMGRGNMNGLDGKLDVKRTSLEMVNQLTELLPINPLGGNDDAVSVIIPDAGKPIYQVFKNKDFFGKPIYKKNDRNEEMPAWTKAFSGTAKWMVNSAEFINEVSGGDKYMSGNVDLNPATVEHVFEGYFGGMGKTANQLFKTLSMIWDEDERMWRNVPVVNRFYTGSDNKISFRKVNEEYYRYMEEYDETEQRLKGYENEAEMGIEEYAEKYDFLSNSKQNERYEVMKEYKKAVDELYRAIKESDPEEKKEIEMEISLLKMEMIEEVGLIK